MFNCNTGLSIPLHVMQGAQNVRCARCGEITPVPVAGGTTIACTLLVMAVQKQ